MKNVNTLDEIIIRLNVLQCIHPGFIEGVCETSRDIIFQLEQQLRHSSGMKIRITKLIEESKQMVWL